MALAARMKEEQLQESVERSVVISQQEVRMLLDGLDALTPYLGMSEFSAKSSLVEKLLNVGTNK